MIQDISPHLIRTILTSGKTQSILRTLTLCAVKSHRRDALHFTIGTCILVAAGAHCEVPFSRPDLEQSTKTAIWHGCQQRVHERIARGINGRYYDEWITTPSSPPPKVTCPRCCVLSRCSQSKQLSRDTAAVTQQLEQNTSNQTKDSVTGPLVDSSDRLRYGLCDQHYREFVTGEVEGSSLPLSG